MSKRLVDVNKKEKVFDSNLLDILSKITNNEYKDLVTIPEFSITLLNSLDGQLSMNRSKIILTGSYDETIKNKNNAYIFITFESEEIQPLGEKGFKKNVMKESYKFDFRYFIKEIKGIESITI